MLKTFFPSTFTGDFNVLVNEGLSILTVNSYASKNGFLKSIGGGFAEILYGPFGWGAVVTPFSVAIYYPPSTDDMISWLTDSPMLEGSNLILTDA